MTFYHSNNAITMYLKPQNIGYVLLYIYQMVLVSMLPSWTPSQITAYCPLGTWIIIFIISFNNYLVVAVLIWYWTHFCNSLFKLFLVRCSKASNPNRGHVSIIDVQNSLNINFTGIHAFEYLFSVKLYEKWDQDEISRTILKIWLLMV